MSKPVPDYYNRINPDLLRLIPRDARLVVEIGCGAGPMGARYKRLNPDVHYVGVELDPDAAAFARQRLDTVATMNVEREDLDAALPAGAGPVDCFVYGDVLEHLLDPWAVIRRHAERLADDGVMLACIPNIQHWSLIKRLLDSSWRYEQEGLLDRTHLRWFTLDGMRDAFAQAGLTVYDAFPRVFNKPAVDDFMAKMAPALEGFGIDAARFRERAAALQFVIRAGKATPRRLLVQAMTLRPQAAVNDIRIQQPLGALATRPGVRIIVQEQTATLPAAVPGEDRIFIWHRPILSPEAVKGQVRTLTERGSIVVTEFDDHPMRWPNIEKWGHLTFRGVHAVQTSTEPLAGLVRRYNPEVGVFPNAIAELPEARQPPAAGEPVTLFFGALNRVEDWAPIMPQLNLVLEEAGAAVRVEVIHDQAFFDALLTQHKRFTPMCDYARYRQILSSADIALLPLGDNEFNRMKSDLKFIETAAAGVVALASPTVYAASLKDGETGFLFATPEEFGKRLRLLLNDGALRARVGSQARDYVRGERMQAQQMADRLRWYRHLAENRERLLVAWRERTAGL